ncbi:hypothetical protein IFR04_014200 [Cadophora malorum]|uniref:BZIP domain-containing protein n=1 Tax=Cadophora malorum TaxID=108018 RepID=A0A8H7T386_9HELO|nr:hypothetical protein IFR04_014200 [Cadophora malorum]
MEHETSFDYAGNLFYSNSYSDNLLYTPAMLDASGYDFSNMLNLSPPDSESQMDMLDLHINPQLARANMPGNCVSGSEYFPDFPASTSPTSWIPEGAMAAAALPMDTFSDLSADEIPQSVPLQSQIESQSDTSAAQLEADIQQCEVEGTHTAGQKTAPPATSPRSASQEPKPKRRRGARKKVRTEEELAIRREKHLQRNRDAAQKCRQKKRAMEDKTKENMIIERQKNLVTWDQVASAQDELETLRNLALGVEHHCHSDDHKTAVKSCLETIITTAAKLQDQVDRCNQRRAQFSQGFVMQRSFGGYAQQDSIQDSPGSEHGSSSPAMSPQSSSHSLNQMLSPRSSCGSSYPTRRLDTNFANGKRTTRKGSSASTLPDSAVSLDSPASFKNDSPVEDEAIEIPVYENEESLGLPASMEDNADPVFEFLTHVENTGPQQVSWL